MDAVRRARNDLAGKQIRDKTVPAWKRRKRNPFGNPGAGSVRKMPPGGDAS
jgi:hypothetical protein